MHMHVFLAIFPFEWHTVICYRQPNQLRPSECDGRISFDLLKNKSKMIDAPYTLYTLFWFKGAWPDLKKKIKIIPNLPLSPWKLKFWYQKKAHIFLIILSWNFRSQVCFIPIMNKKVANFHKSVVNTPKVYTVFCGTWQNIFLRLLWKPLELFCSKFEFRLSGWWASIWSRKQHMKKKSEHAPLMGCTIMCVLSINIHWKWLLP